MPPFECSGPEVKFDDDLRRRKRWLSDSDGCVRELSRETAELLNKEEVFDLGGLVAANENAELEFVRTYNVGRAEDREWGGISVM